MSHVYCSECGFQNPEAANYCSRCGALLEKPASSTESTQTYSAEEVGALQAAGAAYDPALPPPAPPPPPASPLPPRPAGGTSG